MTKKNLTTMTMAMILVLAAAGFAFAGPGYGPGSGRGGCGAWSGQAGPQGWYGQLTPEKQAAVEKIFESYRGKFGEVRTAMQAKRSVLQAMINGGQADEKKITKITQDINSLRDKMFDLRQALSDDLVKETGIETARLGRGYGSAYNCAGPGYGSENCPGNSYGNGRGMRGGHRWQ